MSRGRTTAIRIWRGTASRRARVRWRSSCTTTTCRAGRTTSIRRDAWCRDLPRVDFFHWTLFDLPAGLRSIAAGACSHGVVPRGKAGPMIAHGPVSGALHGLNDYTAWFANDRDMSGDYYGYDGPCPPWNDSIWHHYVFTLSALSVDRVVVTGRVTGSAVRDALAGAIVEQASITGRYSLNSDLSKMAG